jgi:hypothetical protein
MLRALVLLALVAMATAEVQYRTNEIPNSTLTVTTPDDWTATKNLGGAALILRSPVSADISSAEKARTQASVAVAIETLDATVTPEQYAKQCTTTLQRLFPGFTVLDENAETLNGRQWWRVHYQFRTGQLAWEQVMLVSTNDKSAWCVTYSCAQASWPQWQELFDNLSKRLGR